MNYDISVPNKAYFAAANGYSGFRSLFSEIFDPDVLDRIYIIKGGPGTGKSTIIKQIICFGRERGYYCEAIYCSSDPSSLDGAIIKSRGRTVAVLDGTAPHSCDPVYPGAVEEIVDLGSSFKMNELEAEKELIISLTKKKKAAYASAYKTLGIAGNVHRYIINELSKYVDYSKAERLVSDVTSGDHNSESTPTAHTYVSSFSMYGHLYISRSEVCEKETVGIVGTEFTKELLMRIIYDSLSSSGSILRAAPSPFDDSIVEEIETARCVYSLRGGEVEIRAESILNDTPPIIGTVAEIHAKLLEMATSHFKEASTAHAELEEVYKARVDFEGNDRIFGRLWEKISAFLEK